MRYLRGRAVVETYAHVYANTATVPCLGNHICKSPIQPTCLHDPAMFTWITCHHIALRCIYFDLKLAIYILQYITLYGQASVLVLFKNYFQYLISPCCHHPAPAAPSMISNSSCAWRQRFFMASHPPWGVGHQMSDVNRCQQISDVQFLKQHPA